MEKPTVALPPSFRMAKPEVEVIYISSSSSDDEDYSDDCVILDSDPTDLSKLETDLSEKLRLGDAETKACARVHTPSAPVTVVVEEPDVTIIAQRGQVACRDYPHPRHLCGNHPFDKSPHQSYCSQCYCYICDIAAPCKSWNGTLLVGHCHATEADSKWIMKRAAMGHQRLHSN